MLDKIISHLQNPESLWIDIGLTILIMTVGFALVKQLYNWILKAFSG
ncbi:MAG: hypothetical protein HOL62_03305 [Candidatus Marinimicrobia bacterium]|jgi:uncharacterized membrane protein YcjF (UPF0283 family)|nr:hypothetical protein [Candidatus Neomarinimicrobiota bacterium]MBT3944757.1 hypothetical protein [Candidatus Neomarinimicrobiota bacterium]MBT4112007.1 hypothetical protein [Candidatus Neomarinimicrobiota bacterium]MBT4925909.1 hypothetical protein [Candidatus Neomarinimicrobiota bacterium]MBT5251713.1 hypothetical protein [Candidatus Neomarinimicrobiota bacterium]